MKKLLIVITLCIQVYSSFAYLDVSNKFNNTLIISEDSTLSNWISSFKSSNNGLLDIKRNFHSYYSPEENLNITLYKKPNGKLLLLDTKSNNRIINQEFDEIKYIGYKTFKVGTKTILNGKNGEKEVYMKYGIINEKGNVILPMDYSDIDTYIFGKYIEPQFFLCEKTTMGYIYPKNYLDRTQKYISIINRRGKIQASSVGLNKELEISFFINKGIPYMIYQYKSNLSFNNCIGEFSICKINEIPTVKFPGFTHFGFAIPLGHVNFYYSFLKNINPLIIPICSYERNKNGLAHTRLFDLGNSKFISTMPEFYLDGDRNEYYLKESNYNSKSDYILIVQNKLGEESIIKKSLKLEMAFIPYKIIDSYILNSGGFKETYSNIFKNKVLIIENSNHKRGLLKIGDGVILATKYNDIEEISERYYMITNEDKTLNIFDIRNRKMVLYKNFERIGIKQSPTDNLEYSSFRGFSDFVDCIFDGKTERIQLPK